MTSDNELAEQEIVQRGYTLLEDIVTDDDAEIALKPFGVLIPQYNGLLRHEVKADTEHDKRAYSKSINGIPWHVDAPSWDPPPSRMALHCRRQATCGAGHTLLVDMRPFIAGLSEEDRRAMYELPLPWLDRNTQTGVDRPIVERLESGREIIRFRESILKGESDPRLVTSEDNREPLGEFGHHLAELTDEFIADNTIATLIPENAALLWDNQRMIHRRADYKDPRRHLTRYWMADFEQETA